MQNYIEEEQKVHESQFESQFSESLDEEILIQHYQKQQEEIQNQQSTFQRSLKVPPINFQNTKMGKNQAKSRKSPKSQKNYSEDLQPAMTLQKIPQHDEKDELLPEKEALHQRIQFYASVPEEARTSPDRGAEIIQVSNSEKRKKKEQSPSEEGDGTLKRRKPEFDKLEEIPEDVDESNFIPAY